MQIIRNLNQIKISLPDLALTIGNFDGVHLGHLQILSEVKKIAKEKNTTVEKIKKENNLTSDLIQVGQKLKI